MKLFYIQVIDKKYERWAMNNSVRINTLYPSRGEILDRNGLLLAQSKEAYDLYVTPRNLKPFDTLSLCNILQISKFNLDSLLDKCRNHSYRKASLLMGQMDQIKKLRIDELSIDGLSTEYRSVRSYPYNTAGNLLGYVSNVSPSDIESDDFYTSSDYIGKAGIERAYETLLRGEKGQNLNVVNVHGAIVNRYKDGRNDFAPTTGNTLTATIDIRIQKLGEELMAGKIGAIVAIEPATGEILAMISSPTYNPDMLIGSERTANYKELAENNRKPLYNRTVMGTYPPGSTFKMAMGLVALESEAVTYSTMFSCRNGFHYGGRTLGCHSHYSPLSLEYAIQTSCNSYFCNALLAMVNSRKYDSAKEGLDEWNKGIKSLGFGESLNSDIPGEAKGFIPDSKFYDRAYKGNWNGLTIISIAIGQGEILATPLQMANFGVVLANRGHYYSPHVIKAVNGDTHISESYTTKQSSIVSQHYFEPIINAMWKGVNESGTGSIARVNGLDICGKTGTAENGFGEDHSTFLAIAPKIDPKIVVSVYVENGGFGAATAAPIASLIIEKYMTDTITRPELLERVKNKVIEYPHYDNKK